MSQPTPAKAAQRAIGEGIGQLHRGSNILIGASDVEASVDYLLYVDADLNVTLGRDVKVDIRGKKRNRRMTLTSPHTPGIGTFTAQSTINGRSLWPLIAAAAQARINADTPCRATWGLCSFAPGDPLTCTLPIGHEGGHQEAGGSWSDNDPYARPANAEQCHG